MCVCSLFLFFCDFFVVVVLKANVNLQSQMKMSNTWPLAALYNFDFVYCTTKNTTEQRRWLIVPGEIHLLL